jgi:hypothetical protein
VATKEKGRQMYTIDDVPAGSGPAGALTDSECADFYGKSERRYQTLRSLGRAPANFKVGNTNFTGRRTIADDMNRREAEADKLTRSRQRVAQ